MIAGSLRHIDPETARDHAPGDIHRIPDIDGSVAISMHVDPPTSPASAAASATT
jgi:hypothetical protein